MFSCFPRMTYGQAIFEETTSGDPLEMMVDETPAIRSIDEILKYTRQPNANKKINNIIQTDSSEIDVNTEMSRQIMMDKINSIYTTGKDIKLDPFQESLLEQQKELIDQSKTERYIVKYMNEREGSFKEKIGEMMEDTVKISKKTHLDYSLKHSFVKERPDLYGVEPDSVDTVNLDDNNEDSSGKELIILKNKMNPSEFANVLRDKRVLDDIEYIQPDFKMGLNSLKTSWLASENDPLHINLELPDNPEGTPALNTDEESNTEGDLKGITEETTNGTTTEQTGEEVLENSIPEERDTTEPAIINQLSKNKVLVAVIDTGIDITHPDLESSIYTNKNEIPNNSIDDDGNGLIDDVHGWNFVDASSSVYDESLGLEQAHGTHIAGIIAGLSNADQNIKPNENIEILPLQVFSNGTAYTSDIIAAIEYAEMMGARVVNCSFGSSDYNMALKEAIENSNMLFICSAGNARTDLDKTAIYPACFDLANIINVTSCNADGGLSYFSNYSKDLVDIAALGRDITSTLPNGKYGIQNGTSMSTAVISSLAGNVLTIDGSLISSELKERLIDTTDRLSNLSESIIEGRQANVLNAIIGSRQTNVIQNSPENDFDVHGYSPTQAELNQLYSSGSVTQASSGTCFSLVLKNDGTVWSWGTSKEAQCGCGSFEDTVTIAQVVGLTNIVSIAAGNSYGLALKSDGTVWAWGKNDHGQLGDGTWTLNRMTPVQVSGLTDVVSIAAGFGHSLAVKSDGTVWSWGSNGCGQLGDQTTVVRNTPVQVCGEFAPFTDVISVAAGYAHSLALKSDGTIWAWGSNYYDQLGDLSTGDRRMPAYINYISDIVGIAAGAYHSLAINEYGAVYAWGDNSSGQIGDGLYSNRRMPCGVLTNAASIDAGDYFSIAVGLDGTVWAWGANDYGQLGDGTKYSNPIPAQINGLNNVIRVAAGFDHSLAIKSDGTLWAWGDDDYGQLGNGPATRGIPVQVKGLTDVITTVAGGYHSLALKSDGTVWAWGDNSYGQLGDGTTITRATPTQVLGLIDVAAITAGAYYSLALKSDGTVWAWGYNNFGQLGDGSTTTRITPIQVSDLNNIVSIAAGFEHSIAVKSDGTVWTWGNNEYGQLGDRTTQTATTPVLVYYSSSFTSVAAGYYHSLALKSDGTLWSWGSNEYGQLGYNSSEYITAPTCVEYISGIIRIAAGAYHSLAIDSGNNNYVWGDNSAGQIGYGNIGGYGYFPYTVQMDIVGADAGAYYTLTVDAYGNVWSWGANDYGQLGNGSRITYAYPGQILNNISSVSSGFYHSLAVQNDHTVLAWGSDSNGQLGQSRLPQTSIIVQCQTSASTLKFVNNSYTAAIPNTGAALITVSAIRADFYGNPISASAITYELANTYAGVSINSTTGAITITSLAQPGSVRLIASDQNQTCYSTLLLTVGTSSNVTLPCTLGQDIYLSFRINGARDLNKIFTLTYNASDLDLIDLVSQTKALETTAGIVTESGIEILTCTPGAISFKFNRSIPEGKIWSGVINIFRLKAKIMGQTTVLAEYQ